MREDRPLRALTALFREESARRGQASVQHRNKRKCQHQLVVEAALVVARRVLAVD